MKLLLIKQFCLTVLPLSSVSFMDLVRYIIMVTVVVVLPTAHSDVFWPASNDTIHTACRHCVERDRVFLLQPQATIDGRNLTARFQRRYLQGKLFICNLQIRNYWVTTDGDEFPNGIHVIFRCQLSSVQVVVGVNVGSC